MCMRQQIQYNLDLMWPQKVSIVTENEEGCINHQMTPSTHEK